MTPEQLNHNLRLSLNSGRIELTTLPLAPEISLYLLAEDYPRGPLSHDEMMAVMKDPSYWAFCWASGQVLARYILDHKGEFAGRRVLDFGSGSGVVGVAAMLAGASGVIACDIDPMAIDASLANAAANGVTVGTSDDLFTLQDHFDIAIAADVLYDRENMPLLKKLPTMADNVLIADSRVKNVTIHGYEMVDRQEATTIPDLDEFREFNDVKVYRALK